MTQPIESDPQAKKPGEYLLQELKWVHNALRQDLALCQELAGQVAGQPARVTSPVGVLMGRGRVVRDGRRELRQLGQPDVVTHRAVGRYVAARADVGTDGSEERFGSRDPLWRVPGRLCGRFPSIDLARVEHGERVRDHPALFLAIVIGLDDRRPMHPERFALAAAHLRSLTIGHEVIVPVTKGALDLGPWQRVFYGEWDGRRPKRVVFKAMGLPVNREP